MVIGLTGKKQAGKNAVAKLLAVYSPLPVVEVSYAAKLKQSVAALLGCEVDDLERWKNDPSVKIQVARWPHELLACITMREFLQRYGTESHREIFGKDFWLDAALPLPELWAPEGAPEAAEYDDAYGDALYVVTDVRFPNEAERIKELGGTVVRVVGPPEVEEVTDGHASEAPLPDELVDLTLFNDRRDDEFAALDTRVRTLLKMLDPAVIAS